MTKYRILQFLFSALMGVIITIATFAYQVKGPLIQVGTECPQNGLAYGPCYAPQLVAGFPLAYAGDQPGITQPNHIDIWDQFYVPRFVADILIYTLIVMLMIQFLPRFLKQMTRATAARQS